MMNITAVIVTYYPNEDVLTRLVSALVSQVDRLLIVDNNSQDFDFSTIVASSKQISLHVNHENLGVAAGYNQGVSFAIEQSSSHVILFDQDSLPTPTMVGELVNALTVANTKGLSVAAVGPCYQEISGGDQSPFVKVSGIGLSRVNHDGKTPVEVDHLISSGCLIPIEAFKSIGLFEEQLFIDYVDTEWCLRARYKGFALLGIPSATMMHDLGDGHLTILKKRIVLHSPLRHYYLIRNGIWLIKQPWITWQWRVLDAIRLTKVFLVLSIFPKNSFNHFKMMLTGVLHAVTSRMGKFLPRS